MHSGSTSSTGAKLKVGCGERGNEMAEVLTDFPELTTMIDGKEPPSSRSRQAIFVSVRLAGRAHHAANDPGGQHLQHASGGPRSFHLHRHGHEDVAKAAVLALTGKLFNNPAAGVTTAEYFRDMGYNVPCLQDPSYNSISLLRF